MIVTERYGLRSDGNPVIETTTYIPAEADHPAAVQLEGQDGYWVRLAVGNSLVAIGAKEVTSQEFQDAQAELQLRVEAAEAEAEQARELRARELAEKKAKVEQELTNLGLSPQTIEAILAGVLG